MRLFYFFGIGFFLLIASSVSAGAMDIGCRLDKNDNEKKVSVIMTGVKSDIITDTDYKKFGSINVSMTIEGNSNILVTNGSLDYEKVGKRLETIYGDLKNTVIIPASPEDFFNHFGPFPKVTCTSP